MADRDIICKIKTGSYLYGTSRPESDLDFTGVFLPSADDLLGLQNCPGEMTQNIKITTGPRNGVGDVDCKFYSLQRFINLAAKGEPGQLELLFAPPEMYETTKAHPDWVCLVLNRDSFLSSASVWPFTGFALAQAHKTTIKGDNLNRLRAISEWGQGLSTADKQKPLEAWIYPTGTADYAYRFRSPKDPLTPWPPLAQTDFEVKENIGGYDTFRVAGRQFDIGTKVKIFLGNVDDLISRYGTRSQAAAEDGVDYKSLMHAYRLIGQAEELLLTGKITLPRPPEEVKFLKSILNKELPTDHDWLGEISARVDNIRGKLAPESALPEKPRWDRLGELCRDILKGHLNRG